MANSNVAGQGPLLGWNQAQDAISALTRTINDLNQGLKGVSGGVNQMSRARGIGLVASDLWNGRSNYATYRANGGNGSNTPTTGNGGGVTFSGGGGSGSGSGPSGSARMGGGAANNGGRYNLKTGVQGLVNWGQGKLSDQVAMQTVAYQAAQYSSSSWHTLRDQAFKNNFTASSTADAAQAYATIAGRGLSPNTAGFNTQWNYVKGTSGYLNPDMSQSQRAVGTAAAWNAGTYNSLRAFGIQTIQNGQKQSPRQIAQQVFNRFPELRRIKTQQQLSATLNDPGSGLNQSLNGWGLDPNTLELVKGELRGMLLAQTHGASAQQYVSTANQRDNGGNQEVKNAAQSQLGKWGIGGSSANTLMTRAGTLRNQDANVNDAFTSGLQTATKYLDDFSIALQKVLQVSHADSAIGFGGGAGSLVGGALGGGLGALGIARGLGSVTRLPGMFGGLSRLLGGAGGAGGAGAGGAGGAGIAGALGAAALTVAPFLGAGYLATKFDPNGKTITGASTKGMGIGGYLKDTFSWTAIKRNLNPFYVLGDHNKNDGQGGGASGGSGPSAGAGKSGAVATGTSGSGKTAASVIRVAMKYLGIKYVWGGSDPKSGFDCSGLLQYSFRQIGVSIPRTAAQQQKAGKPVKLGQERAGDLLFNGNPAHHVVMCIGNGKIIEAPHTGAVVRVRSYKPGEFTNAVRILGSVGNMNDLTNDNGDTAGSDSNRLSNTGFGGDVGSYGSVEEVDAIAAGFSAIGSANVGSGSGAGQSSTKTTDNGNNAGGALPTGNLKSWIKSALGILHQDTSANERYVNTIAMHESGGNPRAQNNWDSNAKAGHPSKGLMQTIDSTFNHYSLAGHKNIWNPVDNIIAGVRYAESRYGSLANVPGIKSMANGGAYKGYAVGSTNIDVDQNARVHKGEMIIPAYQADAIRKALAGNTPMAGGVGGLNTKGPAPTMNFHPGSIVLQIQGAMDSQSARDAAQQFLNALEENDRIKSIAAGN
ncbi:NlpC/P60 family protein [Streptomyces sp. MI02-2A]|uniref:NlpC/P60 family protein n=1 Tax=Streptomyces sp. MI02-2A TaxID=3028688 RepID=UPI0029A61307|nr:NlpC/P60 family protein [Streptomyces sp. MI02-2A]MDX3260699.1 NlpC/P60 family protein [Streptomyces sp. MI02-2A]